MSENLSDGPVEDPSDPPGSGDRSPGGGTSVEEGVHAPELDYGPHWLRRWHARAHANPVTGLVTKVVVTCVGALVIVAGLVMMVAPGPGIVAILVGLGILSTEWDWADRWVDRLRSYAHDAAQKAREMDPAVRRRRIGWALLGVVVVAAGVSWYLWAFGWPELAVDGWNWVQEISGVVPELPGM
ncbi:PGPGW domain-containing protein [Nocardioides solisilvae]|uniref:PGPGW domain-containing protein n=1 Tax=Nocardioides solisilvae TaxID=1542435 RepID=UPI000D745FFA|nr:PGPGW domain-containing protein [Nocardioides solisilvae]